MKNIIVTLIILVVGGVAYYLIAPVFQNEIVVEDFPIADLDFEDQEEENIIVESTPDIDISVEIPTPDTEEPVDDIIVGQDIVMDEPMMDMEPEVSVVTAGKFVGADARHQGTGQVKIITDGDQQFLRFEDFDVTNGPDLFVTLNKGDSPNGEHVIVQALKGNQGNQNYDVSDYNLDEYNSVSIYCRAFSVEFATATL